ncbi:proton-conducting transporter transmembrane domain-containing protein [Microbacterium trichothecenolyticum]|uniref:NAD(P)H-quinone oxidoreductase subunit 5 n=1 Tax=Microbacterium trichothecenolyticum TaxID=69370 RepID=A0ABU0TWS6_MICTR|nr:proton-conducting transporter membrane subunit [Microbacterium trichothecenolyticum]MDQ1124123.1 NAD(P)H-quinone oxidoreductase subunit 5 [Microbacterium trichothecenolyticum]
MVESTMLAVAVAAPWVAAVIAVPRAATAATAARAAAAITAAGALAAIGGATLRAAGGAPAEETAWAGDALAVVMLILVSGLSAVIQVYALRYLRGDDRQRWFVIWANALTGSSAVMVSAGSVLVFTAGWIAAGICLVSLLGTYGTLPQARQGMRRTALNLLIADTPLVLAALVLTVAAGGDVSFARLTSVLPSESAGIVALLLVVSALGRSAQVPFHRWLPATLSAPTPVSALLHAGVVNAGAILLIRFSPLIAPMAAAMLLIFAAGAVTLVYATAVRLVKPDVKGRLVFSTAGQMGFMMMAVGMGAFAGAVFHLIAHALYKSAMFLSAGSGVAVRAEHRSWPTPPPARPARTVTAIALAVALAVAVLAGGQALLAARIAPANLALLCFVACTAIVAVTAGLRRSMTPGTVIGAAAGLIGGGLLYLCFLESFHHLIAPASGARPASPWLLLLPGLLLLALELVTRSGRIGGALHRALYARAVAASSVRPAPRTALTPSHRIGVAP